MVLIGESVEQEILLKETRKVAVVVMKTLSLAQVFRAVFGCLENGGLGFSGGFLTQLTYYGRKEGGSAFSQ